MTKCSNCPFFGEQNCLLDGCRAELEDPCIYEVFKRLQLTEEGAEKVLHYTQKWRRGAKIDMPSPVIIGKAIDQAIRVMRKVRKNK